MPVSIVLLDDGEGILYLCEGALRGPEIIRANQELLASPGQRRGRRYGLVDFSAAASVEISTSELRILAEQDARLAREAKIPILLAVVAPDDLGYGLARMWQAFAQDIGWSAEVFRERSTAQRWLQDSLAGGCRRGPRGKSGNAPSR